MVVRLKRPFVSASVARCKAQCLVIPVGLLGDKTVTAAFHRDLL